MTFIIYNNKYSVFDKALDDETSHIHIRLVVRGHISVPYLNTDQMVANQSTLRIIVRKVVMWDTREVFLELSM